MVATSEGYNPDVANAIAVDGYLYSYTDAQRDAKTYAESKTAPDSCASVVATFVEIDGNPPEAN